MAHEGSVPTTKPNLETRTLPLQDRVAIVTGSSCGIGREIAVYLASLGARIIVNYNSNSIQAESVTTQINSSSFSGNNPRSIAVRANVCDPIGVQALFDEAKKAFNSPIHILVNSVRVIDSKYLSN